MALSSTYQSTGLPLLSTLYEPPPKHLISVLAPPPNRTGYFRIIRLSSFPLYAFRIVSALRITRTSASFPLGNLLPFAVGLLALLFAPVDGFPVR